MSSVDEKKMLDLSDEYIEKIDYEHIEKHKNLFFFVFKL